MSIYTRTHPVSMCICINMYTYSEYIYTYIVNNSHYPPITRLLARGLNASAPLFPVPDTVSGSQSAFNLIFAHINQAELLPRHSRHALLRVGCLCQEQDVDKQTGSPISKEVSISWRRAAFSRSQRVFPPSAEQKRQRGRTERCKGGENSIRGGPSSSDFSYLPPHKCAHLNVSRN